MAISRSCYFLLPFRIFCSTRGGSPRRTKGRSRGLFVSDLPAVSLLPRTSSPATNREGSLAIAVFFLSGTVPDDPSGCYRKSHAVDFVPFFYPPLEQSFHLTSSSFSSLERSESNTTPWFAPIQSSSTRSQISMRLNPSLFGGSSLYSSRKVVISYHVWILFNGRPVPLRRSFSGDLSNGTVERPRSDVSLSKQDGGNGLIFLYDWAWPIKATKPASPNLSFPRSKFIKEDEFQISTILGDSTNFEIFSGFTGISSPCILSYLSLRMMLPVGSPGLVSIPPFFSHEKCLLPQFLLSMKEDVFSISLSRYSFSFFTGLSSCVAVRTGPEGATETTSVFLVGESWLSTSHCVTILQLSDSVAKAFSTHSNLVLNSLSSSFEELSCLTFLICVVYASNQRGCHIPSFYCNRKC